MTIDDPNGATQPPGELRLVTAVGEVMIVLVGTSHPGNIGSTARAMKTMGLRHLILVSPQVNRPAEHPDARALATGAGDILSNAVIVTSLDEALANSHLAVAMTARTREYTPPMREPREIVSECSRLTLTGHRVAFVFGNERYGLNNEDVMKCQVCCTIPTSEDYSSLNLAQAVQIVAYEYLISARAARPAEQSRLAINPATVGEREGMFTHLEQALVALEFFDREQPQKLIPRLRRLFSRTGLDKEEVNILRGICKAILSLKS